MNLPNSCQEVSTEAPNGRKEAVVHNSISAAPKRKPIGVYLEPGLIQSKAFLALSGIASKVLLWFMYRRQMRKVGREGKQKWTVLNNGEIYFTYSEAQKKYKLTRPRFQRAIDDLIDKGFIEINHLGGGMIKDASTYSIIEKWKNYGTGKFKVTPRKKDTRKLGFASGNWEEKTGKKKRGIKIK